MAKVSSQAGPMARSGHSFHRVESFSGLLMTHTSQETKLLEESLASALPLIVITLYQVDQMEKLGFGILESKQRSFNQPKRFTKGQSPKYASQTWRTKIDALLHLLMVRSFYGTLRNLSDSKKWVSSPFHSLWALTSRSKMESSTWFTSQFQTLLLVLTLTARFLTSD